MKKIWLLICILVIFVLTGCLEDTFTPLDKIHSYSITVNPNDDATLRMEYYLKWEVLEEGDGGVSWIAVGVPNRFVEDIKGLTDNIRDLSYSSSEGATIEIDFNQTYHKGDIFEVRFSFTQKRIFTVNGDEIQYSFNPGWFDEIQVQKLTVRWKMDNVKKHNADQEGNNYLIWTKSLDYGETIETNLVYDKTAFPNINLEEDYSDQTENPLIYIILFSVIAVFIIVTIIASYHSQDHYQTSRGFSGHIHHHHFHYGRHRGYRRSGKVISPPKATNSGSGVGGGGCACACACACAGGGRAGCSRKDFTNYLNI